jgi:3-methyl-2-oxobutanoate hydroxymethyltransferase
MRKKVTRGTLGEMKRAGEKIVAITAYDFLTTRALDRAGVDVILVGDTLGMVVLGYENTLPVTVEEMIHHIKAVARARPSAMIVGDLPFMSYQASIEDAVRNAGRLVKEGGAECVKLEGGERYVPVIKAIQGASIPVLGHLGLTPQSLHQLGGYKVQGKDAESAERLLCDAKSLEEAGCIAVVLECIPWRLAKRITEAVSIPTIGIGAGPRCDGQIIVVTDMLGLHYAPLPKFVKTYDDFGTRIERAVRTYIDDVKGGRFPGIEHSYEAPKGVGDDG